MSQRKVYQEYAIAVEAMNNCLKHGNDKAAANWDRVITELDKLLPHGSGFDVGCRLLPESSDDLCLTFEVEYHPMDEFGGYVKWVKLYVQVKASLGHGFDIEFEQCHNPNEGETFDDENEIFGESDMESLKDYVAELFNEILGRDLPIEHTYKAIVERGES